MGQGVSSKKGSYTPGRGDSELPSPETENGDVRSARKSLAKLVSSTQRADDGNTEGASGLATPARPSTQDGKKEKKRRFIFTRKKSSSGKRSRSARKETANGVRPKSYPPALQAEGGEQGATDSQRSHSMFVEDIPLPEDDVKIDTVSLSSNEEKKKGEQSDVKPKKKKEDQRKSKASKKKKETKPSKTKSEKRKSDKEGRLTPTKRERAQSEELVVKTEKKKRIRSLSEEVTCSSNALHAQPSHSGNKGGTSCDQRHADDKSPSTTEEPPSAVEVVECEGVSHPGLLAEVIHAIEDDYRRSGNDSSGLGHDGASRFPAGEAASREVQEDHSWRTTVAAACSDDIQKIVVSVETCENIEDKVLQEPEQNTSPLITGETQKKHEQSITLPSIGSEMDAEQKVALPFVAGEITKERKLKTVLPDFELGSQIEEKENLTLPDIAWGTEKVGKQKISVPDLSWETKEEENRGVLLPDLSWESKGEKHEITSADLSWTTTKEHISLPAFACETREEEEQKITLPNFSWETKEEQLNVTVPNLWLETRKEEEEILFPGLVRQTREEEQKTTLPDFSLETREEDKQNITLPGFSWEIKEEDKQKVTLPDFSLETREEDKQKIALPDLSRETREKEKQNITLPGFSWEIKEEDKQKVTLPDFSLETREEDKQKIALPDLSRETREKDKQNITLPGFSWEIKEEDKQKVTLPDFSLETREEDKQKIALSDLSRETREKDKQNITLPGFSWEIREKDKQKVALPDLSRETREEDKQKIALPDFLLETREEDKQKVTLPDFSLETREEDKQKVTLPDCLLETREEDKQKVTLPAFSLETREEDKQKVTLPDFSLETREEDKQMIALPDLSRETRVDEQEIILPDFSWETREEDKQKITLPDRSWETRVEGQNITLPDFSIEAKEEQQKAITWRASPPSHQKLDSEWPVEKQDSRVSQEERAAHDVPQTATKLPKELLTYSLPTTAELQQAETETVSHTAVELMAVHLQEETVLKAGADLEKEEVTRPQAAVKIHSPKAEAAAQRKNEHVPETAEPGPAPLSPAQLRARLKQQIACKKKEEKAKAKAAKEEKKRLREEKKREAKEKKAKEKEYEKAKMSEVVVTVKEAQDRPDEDTLIPPLTVAEETALKRSSAVVGKPTQPAAEALTTAQTAKEPSLHIPSPAIGDESKEAVEEIPSAAQVVKVDASHTLSPAFVDKPREVAGESRITVEAVEVDASYISSPVVVDTPKEAVEETLTTAKTIKGLHVPSVASVDKPEASFEEVLLVIQNAKVEAFHRSLVTVKQSEDSQSDATRLALTAKIAGPGVTDPEDADESIEALGRNVDEIMSSIESSVIKATVPLQTAGTGDKVAGDRSPEIPDSPYPDSDRLHAQKADHGPLISPELLSDSVTETERLELVSSHISGKQHAGFLYESPTDRQSWEEDDSTPVNRRTPRSRASFFSPETGEFSGRSHSLKKIELGPRLRTAILRRSTGDLSMSEVKHVNLTKPRQVELRDATPPSRRHHVRGSGEQMASLAEQHSPLLRPKSAQVTSMSTPRDMADARDTVLSVSAQNQEPCSLEADEVTCYSEAQTGAMFEEMQELHVVTTESAAKVFGEITMFEELVTCVSEELPGVKETSVSSVSEEAEDAESDDADHDSVPTSPGRFSEEFEAAVFAGIESPTFVSKAEIALKSPGDGNALESCLASRQSPDLVGAANEVHETQVYAECGSGVQLDSDVLRVVPNGAAAEGETSYQEGYGAEELLALSSVLVTDNHANSFVSKGHAVVTGEKGQAFHVTKDEDQDKEKSSDFADDRDAATGCQTELSITSATVDHTATATVDLKMHGSLETLHRGEGCTESSIGLEKKCQERQEKWEDRENKDEKHEVRVEKCDDRQETCEDWQENCEDWQENCEDWQENCEDRQENCEDWQENCEDRQENCEDRQENCEDRQENCEDRQENCEENCEDWQENCEDRQENCEDRQENCEDCQENCEDWQENCEDWQENCEDRQENCEDWQDNSDDRRENCDDRWENCENWQENCEDRQENCEDWQENCEDRQENCGDRQENCEGWQDNSDDRQENCEDCQENCEDWQENCDDRRENCENWQENCEDRQENCEEWQENCEDWQENCEDRQENCEDWQENCKDRQENCEDWQENCGDKQENCEGWQENSDDRQENCKDRQEKCDSMGNKDKETEQKSEDWEKQYADKRVKREDIKQMCEGGLGTCKDCTPENREKREDKKEKCEDKEQMSEVKELECKDKKDKCEDREKDGDEAAIWPALSKISHHSVESDSSKEEIQTSQVNQSPAATSVLAPSVPTCGQVAGQGQDARQQEDGIACNGLSDRALPADARTCAYNSNISVRVHVASPVMPCDRKLAERVEANNNVSSGDIPTTSSAERTSTGAPTGCEGD